ncbi:MAG: hypothetical protein EP329_27460 [Deltaproteobacteria bacterium]|nr:MAG: hypothetical protein EP329_27460 [Deltaproteobacteria bacterium]
MRLAIIGVGLILAASGCDLSIDTRDGHVSAHLGVRWETPDQLDQVEIVGDATVEVYVDPWIDRVSATAGGGTLDGLLLSSSSGRLSVIGDTAPGVVVVIEVPALERASLVGDGRLSVFDVRTETLDLALTGGGRVGAAGRVRTVRVSASGHGTVDAASLQANTGEAVLRGEAVGILCVSGGLDAVVDADSVLIRRCE